MVDIHIDIYICLKIHAFVFVFELFGLLAFFCLISTEYGLIFFICLAKAELHGSILSLTTFGFEWCCHRIRSFTVSEWFSKVIVTSSLLLRILG